jgi:hypothetical protein
VTAGRDWALLVPAERYQEERLYRRDRLDLREIDGPEPGDRAVLIADVCPPLIFGLGRVTGSAPGPLAVVYSRRLFDAPLAGQGFDAPLAGQGLRAGPLGAGRFAEIERVAGAPAGRRTWLVSVDLPVEAETRGEAVRQFWSYLRDLGPRELPTYVSPLGDELAMQAYLLGAETNLDPEGEE